ncbi:GNAT family N-acetyltransferase [Candidatus Saccharibacteria bacterium]|nr:GNAT family N-acetyltransferase [Candidatus Saccharibacteria bacterium]
MSEIATITIKRLPLTKLMAMHRLFTAAVRTSFTYFDDDVQAKTIQSHSPVRLARAVIDPRRIVLTAWLADELIGYAIGSVPRGSAGQMYWLYVAPSGRGKNTGLALLSRLLKRERALGANTVTLATYDHRRYYERQGFKYIETASVEGVDMDIMRFYLS